jgi:hypothetical protein
LTSVSGRGSDYDRRRAPLCRLRDDCRVKQSLTANDDAQDRRIFESLRRSLRFTRYKTLTDPAARAGDRFQARIPDAFQAARTPLTYSTELDNRTPARRRRDTREVVLSWPPLPRASA